jgi:signal transduction histidine kinase
VAIFEWAVILATVLLLGILLALGPPFRGEARSLVWEVLFWIGLISVVELLQVPVWKTVQVSIGVPLLMAVAFTYSPPLVGVVGLLSSSDPREFRREVSLSRALFNRSQVALSVFFASLVFHGLGGNAESWPLALRAAPPAVLVDFIVNTGLISIGGSLLFQIPIRAVRKKLRIGNAQEFIVSYMGLGLLGVLLARLYADVGEWAVAGFALPLLLARQMFFRTRALEEATQELRDREVVLRALSNRMAEERHDEREQIAAYLHDDLAQILYRISLHLDASRQVLQRGDLDRVKSELEATEQMKRQANQAVRALVRDLHRSPLGRAGLVQTLASYFMDVEKDAGVPIRARMVEVDMPPPVQLLCYHVTREAVMNAVKHAGASAIEVTLEPAQDGARVTVRDDGKGFDPDEGPPEGHFGMKIMRERAQVAGGTFRVDSAPGQGTTVTAEFPTSLFEETKGPPLPGGPDGQA